MKRFLILIMLLVAVSCGQLKEPPKWVPNESERQIYTAEFTYKGHEYIGFKDNRYYGQGFVHNPDCPCMSNRKAEWY